MKEGTVSHITNIFQESERLKKYYGVKEFLFWLNTLCILGVHCIQKW